MRLVGEKMKNFLASSVLLVALLGFGGESPAATLGVRTSSENKDFITMEGEIVAGDTNRFKALVLSSNNAGREVSNIRLNSPGGLLSEGASLAAAIRFAKIATVVPSGGLCASACFLAFAGGSERYVNYDAQVGVHGASDRGRETKDSEAATIVMVRIAKELGVPDSILGRMAVTPPSDMVWLTPNDLRSMGSTMTGNPSELARTSITLIQPQTGPTSAVSKRQPTWVDMVAYVIDRSRSLNGGREVQGRVCQPELKVCITAIWYKLGDRSDAILRTTEDVNGKVQKREVCTLNSFADVRTCFNWDNYTISKDMKNARGEWYTVESN